jgi:predicted alpha/beta-hydrolase family hydrolase
VRGLVFFAFPLHPAGKPSTDRAPHLSKVALPMLFLQGTKDALADISLIQGVVRTRRSRRARHHPGRRPLVPCAGPQRPN